MNVCRSLRVKFQTLKEEKLRAWKEKRVSEVLEIINNRSPTELWGLLRRFKGQNFVKNNISPLEWMSHFKNVLGGVIKLDTYFAIPHFRYNYDLDKPFEENELLESLKSLKNNKAPGFDGIPAELYKYAIDQLRTSVVKLACHSGIKIIKLNNIINNNK
jgi:hypothetical protein